MSLASSWKIRISVGIVVVLVLITGLLQQQSVSWFENYSRYQESPFGTRFIYDILDDRTGGKITPVPFPPADFARSQIDTESATWLNISQSYDPDSLETAILSARVENGMNAFIATRPGGSLTRWLGVYYSPEDDDFPLLIRMEKPEKVPITFEKLAQAEAGFSADKDFVGGYLAPQAYALGDDISVLAKADGRPIFVRVRKGEGSVYLLSAPRLLTNYAVWEPELEPVVAAILSHLPETPLIWDEYYETGFASGTHPLRVVLAQPGLSAAWFTLLVLAALFLLFRVKRTARAVPLIPEPKNATAGHIKKLSRLYEQTDRQGKIIEKRIRYLASRLGIESPELYTDEKEIARVSEKFGISREELLTVMSHYGSAGGSKGNLSELSNTIDKLHRQID